jgi:hypothetical protein
MEREYMGTGRAKVWTYLIVGVMLVIAIVVANFAIANPTIAREGVDAFMGMPPWGFPLIGAVVGLLVYMVGLKIETDWPEAVGALLVAGSIAAGEILLGWENFQVAGMVVVPYLLPVVVFLGMLGYSVVRSR